MTAPTTTRRATSAELAAFRRALLDRPGENINGPAPADERELLTDWLAHGDETPGAIGSEDIIGIGRPAGTVSPTALYMPHPGALYMPAPDGDDLDAHEIYGVGAVTYAAAEPGAWYAWLRRHARGRRAYWHAHPHGATEPERERGIPLCRCVLGRVRGHAWMHEHDCPTAGTLKRPAPAREPACRFDDGSDTGYCYTHGTYCAMSADATPAR